MFCLYMYLIEIVSWIKKKKKKKKKKIIIRIFQEYWLIWLLGRLLG